MANTTKGSGKTKKKTSASGTAKKKQTQTTARKTTVKKSSTAKRTSGTRKNTVREPMDEGVRAEIILLSVLAVSILLMLSNFGMGGVIGQAVCDFFFGLFGVTEWAAPVLIFFGTAFYIANRQNFLIVRKTGGAISCFVFFCAFMQLLASGYTRDTTFLDYYFDSAYDHLGGGILGGSVVKILGMGFGQIGAWVIIVIAIVISVIVMTQKPILAPIHEKTNDHRRMAEERRQERLARQAAMEEEEGKELILEPVEEPKKAGKKKKSRLLSHVESKADLNENDDTHQMEMPELSIHRGSVPAEEPEKTEPEMTRQAAEEAKKEKTSADHTRNPRSSYEEIEADVDGIRQEIWKKAEEKRPEYKTPPMNLLKKGTRGAMGDSDAHLREVARKLEETLDSFGVKVTVNNVSCGPTVTRYELMPEQGVKVSRIVGLTDDIKLSLAAADVRIEAPIPGKSAVGIEVPNKTNTAVMLRDLLETPEFKNFSSNLAFAVGKDIAGQPVIADIAKMPHLLIAGATGSGKSVCINSLIVSMLYHSTPQEVKLVLIDPKMVELGIYNGIPHLLIPVVTDPKKAAGALSWAVNEMLNRYQLFKDYSVRDMTGFNRAAEKNGLKPMPQIVIIIDELADLMMAAPGEVEDSICRLAQMARAAGMHLVIATQRPSVDVITGVIKANIPSRIAFAVSSQIDSRTILDSSGAEKLLGRGDMLFSPIGSSKPTRVQGCFVTDGEVERIIEFIKQSGQKMTYDEQILQEIDRHAVSDNKKKGGKDEGGGFSDEDEMLPSAIEIVVETGQASTSMLQRRLKLGYARAARLMDAMEEKGIIGPFEGSKPRQVLITKERWIEMKMVAAAKAEDDRRNY